LNTPYNLKRSKEFTDALMNNGVVEIELKNSFNLNSLLRSLKEANANVEFIE
jgi:hypothetical protein